jgi:tRNA A-37 threonylcarbamoyl transferase component Bud32
VTVAPADETRSSDQNIREDLPQDDRGVFGPRVARPGTTLGRYVLGDVLGHGAMATVFRARDRQLGRTVAIKVMNLAIAARSDAGERFRREAQAAAALRHPGIVEIYDFAAATGDEPAYIVAELISGPTLSDVLAERRGRLLPEVAILISAEVADALAAAHERGIVHRDIKPDNVMVEKTSTASRVVITDFGVAHVTGLETMTATGALVGSPAYMSPEQARGQDVAWATDIWAMGVMLYQMVTGALPFPGREPFAVIASISRGEFRRPSQLQATVAPELEQIIVRCLAPEPARRGTSARALAEELRALAGLAGFDDGPSALRRFLDEPEAFEAQLRPRVADAAVERARRHVRRGELARALTQVGRATAYVPDHHGAATVIRSVSARRRWARGALGLVTVAALTAAAFMGYRVRMRWVAARATAAAARAAALAPSERASKGAGPPPAEIATAVNAPATGLASMPSAKSRSRVPARKKAVKTTQSAPAEAEVAPAPAERGAAIDPAPQPPAVPTEPPVAPGKVTLMSWRAFCFPSLDDEPVTRQSPVSYPKVTPGRHRVFCDKQLVGEIEVLPGGHMRKTILRGSDGKPLFGSPGSGPGSPLQ